MHVFDKQNVNPVNKCYCNKKTELTICWKLFEEYSNPPLDALGFAASVQKYQNINEMKLLIDILTQSKMLQHFKQHDTKSNKINKTIKAVPINEKQFAYYTQKPCALHWVAINTSWMNAVTHNILYMLASSDNPCGTSTCCYTKEIKCRLSI